MSIDSRIFSNRAGLILTLLLLGSQLILFQLSIASDFFGLEFTTVSIFCTASETSWLSSLFGMLHLSYILLFIVGIAALRIPHLRLGYAAIMLVMLIGLPIQYRLVAQQTLYCDVP